MVFLLDLLLISVAIVKFHFNSKNSEVNVPKKRVNVMDGERFSVYEPDIIGCFNTGKIWKIILWPKRKIAMVK